MVCDFKQDCSDGQDEAGCPTANNFAECPKDHPNCYWPEMRKDGLDWVITTTETTKKFTHGPLANISEDPGKFTIK